MSVATWTGSVVRGPDGSKRAGDFLPPKAVELSRQVGNAVR